MSETISGNPAQARYLNRHGQLTQLLEKGIPLRHGIAHTDMIKSYLDRFCLGKTDFEAIENHRDDDYLKAALVIHQMPSRLLNPPHQTLSAPSCLFPATIP